MCTTGSNRSRLVHGLGLVLVLLVVGTAGVRDAGAQEAGTGRGKKRPNVIFILADDLGWMDTSVYGSRYYRTPNLERLARRGMRFTSAYAANPLCSPTRASILTGLYPGRLRFTTPAGHLRQEVLDPKLPAQAPPHQKAVTPQTCTRLPHDYYTLAEALKDGGYRTAHFGKWHLGWEPYLPESQGFEWNRPGGSYPGPPSYLSPYKIPAFPNGPAGEHIDDRLTQEAIQWLRQNRDRPFFLNYWLFSVHAPFQGKPDLIEASRQRIDPSDPQRNPVMAAMVEAMDGAVGKLLDAIEELGLGPDTLIVFASDNGGNMYSVVEGGPPTSNHPLRGGKATIYEGGTRTPLIVAWPGRVKPGTQSDVVVSSIDFYPTLLEATGLAARPGQQFDGISLLPVLRGAPRLEREALFCHFPHYTPATGNLPSVWVRRGDWKLIRFFADGPKQEDRFELYHLAEDLGETRNRAAEMPERLRELNALIDRHLKETGALVPIPNPAYGQETNGWSGNAQVLLSINAGKLVVRSTGDDPFLMARGLSLRGGPFTVELRMKSASRGPGQVFWTTRAAPNFHRDRSVGLEVKHDGEWHDYRVELPVPGPLTALRLDPGTAPGEIRIEYVRVRGAGNALLKEWTFR